MIDWTTAERRAWKWPDAVKPSRWAEANRVLGRNVTVEPGPWRNERTPYLAGVMDAVAEPGVEEVVIVKAAQVGFSESLRNLLGFWIDHEPGPCLVVMPDQKSAEELIEERVKPLLTDTPAVARHVTSRAWDVKKSAIRLDTMSIYIGWAGSSQALKSRPIRYLLLEEPDEYPATSGTGGDPISKAMKRVTTYAAKGRARVVIGGTPTTRLGNTWRAWESCGDQRHFWCPCPQCGRYQRLYWKQVKYLDRADGETRKAHAARVLDAVDGGAWYECEDGKCRIAESQKIAMLRRGVWAGSDQAVAPDGRVVGPSQRHRRVGYCLPATYSPWVSFAKLAAEWIEAQDDVQQLADFVNQRLAEPFEEQRAKTVPDFIKQKSKGAPAPLIIPKWARVIIATADTQGTDESTGYFWYVIRAWGHDYRSQLIDFGVCSSKPELLDRCLTRSFPVEDGGRTASPFGLWIDSGGPRWSEVYQLAQTDNRVHPTKGENYVRDYMVTERVQRAHNVVLWKIDTMQSKDLLHRLIHDPDETKWLPHNQVNDDYCRQMCSESKVFDPSTRREEWVEVVRNMNHLWDCEHQQCAVAWRVGCGTPEPPRTAPQSAPAAPSSTGFLPSNRW
jgi:phage terminase large subunit GpA-like protein